MTHEDPSRRRRLLLWPHHALALITALTGGCIYDSSTLTTLRCEREGERDGSRVCREGVWVASAPDDMAPIDQPPSVDLPDLTPDLAPDMPPDDGPELPCDAPDPARVCALNDPTTRRCETTLSAPDSCGVMREVRCPACADGEQCDSGGRCVCVGEEDSALCAQLSAQAGALVCGDHTSVVDRCGVTRDLTCPDCEGEAQCVDQRCVIPCDLPPQQQLCDDAGAACGPLRVMRCDMAVEVASCGDCTSAFACLQNQCVRTTTITRPQRIQAGDAFGTSMALDGDTLAVSIIRDAPGAGINARCGSVAVFTEDRASSAWPLQARVDLNDSSLCNSGDEAFGLGLALADDLLVVGAPGDGTRGRIFLYKREGTGWPLAAMINRPESPLNLLELEGVSPTTSARAGESVAAIKRGQEYVIVIGAPDNTGMGGLARAGTAHVLRCDLALTGCDQQTISAPATASDARFGASVALLATQATPAQLWVGAPQRMGGGAVHQLQHAAGAWSPVQEILLSAPVMGDAFGSSLALASGALIASAPGREGGEGEVVSLAQTPPPVLMSARVMQPLGPAPRFGAAIAAHDTLLLSGAPQANTPDGAGAAYLHRLEGGAWRQEATLRAPVPAANMRFGASVALHPRWAIVGAPGDLEARGSVFLFKLAP